MRYWITNAMALVATMTLVACDQGGLDDEALTESAQEAITYVDDELDAGGLQRDLAVLSDERLMDEAREIARYAEDHGCDVEGVLGGLWTDEDQALHGRWFKLDRSLGGDLEGSYTPDETEDGGLFEGSWSASDGRHGDLGGDYYDFGNDQGAYLGTYEEIDGDAAGLLGGLWYRNGDEGGVFFGVWGHCGEGAEDIEPESY